MSTYQSEGIRRPVPPPPPSSPPPPAPDLQVIQAPAAARQQRKPVPARRPPAGRPSGLRLADRRGLTGLGAVALVVLFAALAGAVDGHRSGDGLGWIFGVTFVICCVVAALIAHTEDMGAVAILPPLAYLVGVLACAAFRPNINGLSALRTELLIAMLLGAPALFVAEALTLLTTGLRGMRTRAIARARRPLR